MNLCPRCAASCCPFLCCCRGTGGRERGSNPTRDPKIHPHQAQHILKKRHTAGLSKFKKKVAGLVSSVWCSQQQQH